MPSLKPYLKAKDQPCFVLRYTDPDTKKQIRKYLHMTKNKAEIEYEKKKIELSKFIVPEDSGMSLKVLINLFLEWVSNNREHSTYERYKRGINNFVAVNGLPQKVQPYHIEKMKSSLKQKNRNPNGINSDLRPIRAMLNWGKKMEYVEKVPHINFFSIERKKPCILSNEEIKTILDYEKTPELNDIIRLYLLTGARANELFGLKWGDFSEKNRFIVLGKRNKRHQVELSEQAYQIMMKYNGLDTTYVIPYTYNWFSYRLDKISKLTGIKFTCHDLRRASGSILLRNEASIYEVSKFLGHSSVQITEKWYVDLLKEDYVKLSEKLAGGLEKLG
jgi:integrase